jgi:hypothetical protein
VRVYLALGVGLACLTLGAAVYWFRDIRSWRSVSVLEVVLAAAGGVVAFVTAADPWSRWIGIGAAAFAVADGLGRLRAPHWCGCRQELMVMPLPSRLEAKPPSNSIHGRRTLSCSESSK